MPIDASHPSTEDILLTSKAEYRILLEMQLKLLNLLHLLNSSVFRKLIAGEFATGGLYIMPSKSSSLIWDGILFVRSGFYKNGIFRFSIHLETEFPFQKSPPIITLLSQVLHPLISSKTFIFDSSSAFPLWSENDHIYELLKFFKYCIESIDYCCKHVKAFSNELACELFTNDRNKFIKLTQEIIAKSVNDTFNSDQLEDKKDVFTFDKSTVEDTLHEQILENMKDF